MLQQNRSCLYWMVLIFKNVCLVIWSSLGSIIAGSSHSSKPKIFCRHHRHWRIVKGIPGNLKFFLFICVPCFILFRKFIYQLIVGKFSPVHISHWAYHSEQPRVIRNLSVTTPRGCIQNTEIQYRRSHHIVFQGQYEEAVILASVRDCSCVTCCSGHEPCAILLDRLCHCNQHCGTSPTFDCCNNQTLWCSKMTIT